MSSASLNHHDDQQISDLSLRELSERLYPDDYRRLGLRLGALETRLAHLERAQGGNLQECSYQVLIDWKKREGCGATAAFLISELTQIGNRDAAEWLLHTQAECHPNKDTQQSNGHSVCARGNLPSLPACLTDRPVELVEVKEKLHKLSPSSHSTTETSQPKATHWLVVHGMGGMGKSVLINQAVRDEEFVRECFPDGVFWVCIGAAVKGPVEITDRLETLCRMMDDGLLMAPSPPKTKDQWKNLLGRLIANQYPRSLIVLDDVWEQETIQAFDINGIVAITTRDAGIYACAVGMREEVVLAQGFTESQSLQALSTWTATPPDNLPRQAGLIHQLSRGSPLVISLVGSLLREHPKRWEYYVTQLEQRNLKKLSTVRDAIHLSVEELPLRDEMMKLLSWFAVFDRGTSLCNKTLSMLEGCSIEEVEDRMKILTQRHLVIPGSHLDDMWLTCYWLHDLVYDYLVSEDAGSEKDLHVCNEFKSLMVFKRFRACRKDMIQTSLCLPHSTSVFQKAKPACIVGSSRNAFYVKEVVDHRPPVYSVTHRPAGKYAICAKLLPSRKEVITAGFGGQVQITNFKDGKSRPLIQGHADNVTHLSISSDGCLLATCSPINGVSVWDFQQTDGLLPLIKNINHPGSRVSRCSFVGCSGTRGEDICLVSADEAGCLKIWSSSFTLQHTIQAHTTAVISCRTCDRERAIVSCAKDDPVLRVFSVQSGSERFHLDHTDALRDCAFLSNGLVVSLTWCLLQVYSPRGKRLCSWSDGASRVDYHYLSCANGSRGRYIAVRGVAGVITVLKLGKLFTLRRQLTLLYRLNVGGVYRDILSMEMECVANLNGSSEEYLVTNQRCGLILVWKLEKEKTRPQIDGNVFDVSFRPDGNIRGIVGTKPRHPRTCQVLYGCSDHSFLNCVTTVYKTGKLESMDAIRIPPEYPGQVMLCTNQQIKVSNFPHCVMSVSKKKAAAPRRGEFSVTPTQDKILLARLIGENAHHLLTVSSGTGTSLEIWSSIGSSEECRYIDFRQGLSADLSHDQTKIAVGCSNGTALLFSLSDFTIEDGEPETLELEGCRVTSCHFSPTGELLALAGGRQVRVFDAHNRSLVAESFEKALISDVHFTPDNNYLVIVAGGKISICDVRTLRVCSRATAYSDISDLQFSSDGSMLVTAGAVKYFEKGYLEWWRLDQSGCISQLQKFMLNSRIKRVVCNQYFTLFVTVDEVDDIYVLERVT